MEALVSSEEAFKFLFSKHYINSFNIASVTFDDELVGVGFHKTLLPDPLYNFLLVYFTEVCGEINIVLTEEDMEQSAYSKVFKGVLHYFWKALVRFQEIYWSKEYDFNLSPEIIYSNSVKDLNFNVNLNKAFMLVNLSSEQLTLNSDFFLEPKSFCVSLNCSTSYFTFTEPSPFLFIPIY